MAIKVTLTSVLPDWWGAEYSWKSHGPEGVKELILEDVQAFVEEATWDVVEISHGQDGSNKTK